MIRRLLVLLIVMAGAALAQNVRYDNIALGPKGPIPFATVAVCKQPANLSSTPCTPPANLCSSLTDATCAQPNPVTADSLGNYHFYIPAVQAPFTVQLYGPQVAAPFIMPDQSSTNAYPLITVGNPSVISPTADVLINTAIAALPSTGGFIDARGFGCSAQTIAAQITVGSNTQPVFLLLNPCTTFLVTQTGGGVVFLVGNGSTVSGASTGGNRSAQAATIFNTATANISFDFAPVLPGSQENYNIDGIVIASDPAATISGGLIQVNGVFINSRLRDIYTFNCYAPSSLVVTAPAGGVIKGTSDIVFDNDNFDCAGHSTGPVVSIFSPTTTGLGNLGFLGGGIQHAGAGQSLLTINGNSQGPSTGTGATGFYFYGTQFETIAPGGNLCSIQLIDAQHVSINSFSLTGPVPAGTSNAVCVTETAAGRSHDISVDHISTAGTWTNLFSATPFGASAILTGVGVKEYLGYRYNGTTTYINSALGFGGNPIHFYQTTTDAPGAITVNANTCTDRAVSLTGLLTSAVIMPTANYAIEAGIAPEAGQTVAGTAHYRICNHTTGNVTLNAGSTFNLAILQ